MTNPVTIKLKQKYLVGFRSGQKSPGGRAGVKTRRKLGDVQKRLLPPQPKMIMHVYAGGKTRMERVG